MSAHNEISVAVKLIIVHGIGSYYPSNLQLGLNLAYFPDQPARAVELIFKWGDNEFDYIVTIDTNNVLKSIIEAEIASEPNATLKDAAERFKEEDTPEPPSDGKPLVVEQEFILDFLAGLSKIVKP